MIDGYRQCYVFDNIFLCKYYVNFKIFVVLLISYICGIVLVGLKLLQFLCNRIVNHLFISKQWVLNPLENKIKKTL